CAHDAEREAPRRRPGAVRKARRHGEGRMPSFQAAESRHHAGCSAHQLTSTAKDRESVMAYEIKVNGVARRVDVDADTPVLWVLRDVLGMTGTKFGCGAALCGACTIHVDGAATRSCITTIESVVGSEITTIEAIGKTDNGRGVQKAWLDVEVVQCGYCQSGQIMSAAALLAG